MKWRGRRPTRRRVDAVRRDGGDGGGDGDDGDGSDVKRRERGLTYVQTYWYWLIKRRLLMV